MAFDLLVNVVRMDVSKLFGLDFAVVLLFADVFFHCAVDHVLDGVPFLDDTLDGVLRNLRRPMHIFAHRFMQILFGRQYAFLLVFLIHYKVPPNRMPYSEFDYWIGNMTVRLD